jgi:pimeloyl-ACP methyl ester carboxylesterase
VTPYLRAGGHEVYTPTLTGYGERIHLAHPDIGADILLQDITNVLTYEDLSDVILASWSYGCFIITGVAHRAPERIAHLVFLDGRMPTMSGSYRDLQSPEETAVWEERLRTEGDGWRIPHRPHVLATMIEDPDLFEWVNARMTPQPWFQPWSSQGAITLDNPLAATIPRTYVNFTDGGTPAEFLAWVQDKAQSDPLWHYREIACNHHALVLKPCEVADLLLEAAGKQVA